MCRGRADAAGISGLNYTRCAGWLDSALQLHLLLRSAWRNEAALDAAVQQAVRRV